MTTINATLNTEQFIKVFGENEYVRDFTPKAIEFILGYASDNQGDSVCNSDWKNFFMNAEELTDENLINEHIHHFNDQPEQILDLVNRMDDASDELINKIDENIDGLSAKELLASVKSEIEACEDWVRAATNLIADNYGWHDCEGTYVIVR